MGPKPSSSLVVRLAVSLGLLVLLSSASVAFGQSSMVSGAVVEPQGNAVSGATITITSTVSGIARTVTTNLKVSIRFRSLLQESIGYALRQRVRFARPRGCHGSGQHAIDAQPCLPGRRSQRDGHGAGN